MYSVRQILGATGIIVIIVIATVGSITAPSASPTQDIGRGAYAQEQPSTTKRIHIWTRARIAAAKKRWAQNREKFAYCSEQLQKEQKTRWLRPHGQADFMQDCMNRNR